MPAQPGCNGYMVVLHIHGVAVLHIHEVIT